MWTPLLFCLLVVAATQVDSSSPWKGNTQYKYRMTSRTLTALHQVANQYTGVFMKATVNVQQKSENVVSVQVNTLQFAEVHANLSKGWSTPIPDSQLHYQDIRCSKQPFELKYTNGAITGMVVSKQTPVWEVNILKSIASQLQVDTQAENLQDSRINSMPTKESVNGVYKTMEDSVSGECETLYDVSPLPRVVIQNKPYLAPKAHLQGDGQLIDIVKTRNFSNCDAQPAYHFGITGLTDWDSATNQMGTFLARSSVSRVVISGNLQQYTIQSTVTTNKIIMSPFLFDRQNGMVVSRMNLTLVDVNSASGSPPSPSNPQTIKNLVYEYNPASSEEGSQKSYILAKLRRDDDSSSSSSSSSDSSSSSSSSSDSSSSSSDESFNDRHKQSKNRAARSVDQFTEQNGKFNWQDSQNQGKYDQQNGKFGQGWQQGQNQGKNHNNQQWSKNNRYNSSDDSSSSSSSSDSSSSSSESGQQARFSLWPWGKGTEQQGPDQGPNKGQQPGKRPSRDHDSSSSSDSDSSSSGSWSPDSDEEIMWQTKPPLSQAPNFPFLPMFIANQGNSIQSFKEFQGVTTVKKIAEQIGYEFQFPSAIPGQNTLNKFTILVRILRTMNAKQMDEAAKQLYFPLSRASSSSSADNQKYHAWVAYRDAVAQAGTGPALLTIKDWIQSKKVQGEEAAELFSVLPNTARFPSTEYMSTFFALATSSEVQNQAFANTSALFAVTDLARKAFVSNSTAYNRFPVHVFGPVRDRKVQPVVHQYIPYFIRVLNEAVSREDSHKIHTYIVALGNLAHPSILNVFEPYLEGRKPMTHFQRLTIVAALNNLAKFYPKVARPVFYRIYQNVGEATELRVMAVYMIMKTAPPTELLQRLAEFTNYDLDPQVISAVQSAIRSAAYNLDNSDYELKMNAQAAVNLLNPKEMPLQFSKNYLRSYYARELNLAYKQTVSYIGSDDGFFPSNIFYSLRQNLGGFKKQSLGFTFMSTSLEQLYNVFEDQFEDDTYGDNGGQGPQGQFPGQHGQQGQFPGQHGQQGQFPGQHGQQGQFPGQHRQQGQHGQQGQFPGQHGQFSGEEGQFGGKGQFDRHSPDQQSSHHSSRNPSFSGNTRWDYESIDKKLNIEDIEQEQLEANLLFSSFGGKRFFAIDNQTIEQLPQFVKEYAAKFRSGHNYNFTKISDRLTVTVAFPTATGLPFIYSLRSPILVSVGGQARLRSQPDLASGNRDYIVVPQTLNASIEMDLVVSSRVESTMSILTPFNYQYYVAGINKNVQFFTSFHADVDVDVENNKVAAKVRPLDQHNKQNVFEYSTVPYTSTHSILKLAQNSQQELQESRNPNTKIVHVRQPNQIHKTFGQHNTGYAFDFDYHSEQKFLDFASIYNEARKHDPVSAFVYAWAEDSINLNNVTLAYNPQKSSAKSAYFTAAYSSYSDDNTSQQQSGYDQKTNYRNSQRDNQGHGSGSPEHASPNTKVSASMAQPSSSSPDSDKRQQEFLYNAANGIPSADAHMIDLSAEFSSQSGKGVYVATIAVASSNVSATSRLLFFAEKRPPHPSNDNKQGQFCAAAESNMPNVPLMNYNKAFSAEPASFFNADFLYGEKCQGSNNIHIDAEMKQSAARRQYLENLGETKVCKQEIAQGNTVQYACRNLTTQANLLDHYKFTAKFDKVPDYVKNYTYKAYAAARYALRQYTNEDLISARNPANKIEVEARFADDLRSVNVSVDAPILSAEFKNVRVNKYVSYAVVQHPEYSPFYLFSQGLTRGEAYPTCAIDNTLAETFDNTTYPIKLGRCWHALVHYSPKTRFEDRDDSSSENENININYSVLARDASSSSGKEVIIVIGGNHIHLQPPQSNSIATVRVNDVLVQISKNSVESFTNRYNDYSTYAYIYALPTGAVRVFAPEQDMEIQYDGTAIKIKASNSHRSEVRGLCGTFNTQPEDDFTVPQNCVLEDPFEFAATYALDDRECEGPAKQYKQKAEQKIQNGECFRDVVIYGNVVSDRNAQRPRSGWRNNNGRDNNRYPGSKQESSKGGFQRYQSCSQKRIQMMESNGQDCFSLKPLLQCSRDCSPQHPVEKNVEFRCFPPSRTTEYMKQKVRNGESLDFSQQGQSTTTTHRVNVPQSCSSS